MQRFYGDEPHIIDRGRRSARGKRRYARRGPGAISIILLAVCAAALLAVSAAWGNSGKKVPASTWYFLSAYTRSGGTEAAVSASDVRGEGGAGYIINDGAFRVIIAVYPGEADAKKVAARLDRETEIIPLAIPAFDLGGIDEDERERVKEALNVHSTAYDMLMGALAGFEGGGDAESELLFSAAKARELFDREYGRVADCKAARELGDYLAGASRALAALDEPDEAPAGARVRYAVCDVIYKRYLLGTRLNGG